MFANYVWEREGAVAEVVDVVHAATMTRRLSFRVLLRYAAILNDSGRPLDAIDLVERACHREPDKIDSIGYVDLLRILAVHSRLKPRRGDLAIRISAMLDQHMGRFEALLRENAESFCIVGNSPNIIGSGNGAMVDAKHLVIRLNNYPSGVPYESDYGRKIDIWVRSGFNDAVFQRPLKSLRHVVLCGNNIRNRYSDGMDLFMPYLDHGIPVEPIPGFIYRELFKKIEASPSAGLASVWWSYRTIGQITPSNSLAFSMIDNSDFVSRYPTGEVQGLKPSRHNWEAERCLYDAIVADRVSQ